MKRFATVLAAGFLVMALLTGCGGQGVKQADTAKPAEKPAEKPADKPPAPSVNISIASAQVGGAWYPLAGAMAEIIKQAIPGSVSAAKPGGGIANIFAVADNSAQLGFGFPGDVQNAVNGVEDFKDKKIANIRAVTSLYPGVLHFAASPGSKVKKISDLKGKILCVPPKGNTAEAMARVVLEAYGLSYSDLKKVQYVSFADAANLVRDGHADALAYMSTVPYPSLMDLAQGKGVTLVPIDAQQMEAITKKYSAFYEYVIPAGAYKGTDSPTAALATTTLLFTRAEMPDDLVYKITKALYDNRDKLIAVAKTMEEMTLENGPKTGGVPLHPGAEKFFKEGGK